MAEYIEREALKDAFDDDGHLSCYVEDMIDDAPAADVIPVAWIMKQVDCGKWRELVQRWRESNHG